MYFYTCIVVLYYSVVSVYGCVTIHCVCVYVTVQTIVSSNYSVGAHK